MFTTNFYCNDSIQLRHNKKRLCSFFQHFSIRYLKRISYNNTRAYTKVKSNGIATVSYIIKGKFFQSTIAREVEDCTRMMCIPGVWKRAKYKRLQGTQRHCQKLTDGRPQVYAANLPVIFTLFYITVNACLLFRTPKRFSYIT